MNINTILQGDTRHVLKTLPDNSVGCCVTSPPYYGLRDYGVEGQIGLEDTSQHYIKNLVAVFNEIYRILTDDGVLWLNIGDSYNGSGNGTTRNKDAEWCKNTLNKSSLMGGNNRAVIDKSLKPKDLIGIPWMLAFALRDAGWYLRQDIIWHKPNPMPESVKDRCTKSHEYIFLLTKSAKYYFDYEAIAEKTTSRDNSVRNRDDSKLNNTPGRTKMKGLVKNNYEFRNKRSVWSVCTKPFKDAHFAVFPTELIVDCIKAGCPVNGIVIDPFMGSGTTAIVARKLDRNYIGVELNTKYIKIAERRLKSELGLFK